MNITQIRYEINNNADMFPNSEKLDWDLVARNFSNVLSTLFKEDCPDIVFDGCNTQLRNSLSFTINYENDEELTENNYFEDNANQQIILDAWAEFDVCEDSQS